ncbi:MAG: site-specific DNA-methyltransferase, partial [Candidatus Dormibacteraeota bacterium]|nr:site-specific DNA-methyltransferase [Candidatus Dormibacteraeota bacterium]
METNALYFGDNLRVLSEKRPDGTYIFASESVDLVYLDPPFNSNRNYNLIFKEASGGGADAQIRAFDDSWQWDATARDTFEDLTSTGINEGRIPDRVGRLVESLVRAIGRNDMSAYLVMMTPRLVQLHRILKATGTLYLHCDPTANGYLRVVLDQIFGPERFLNEIAWKRTGAHSSANRYGPNFDTLLVYAKGPKWTWNPLYTPYDPKYIAENYKGVDPDGRRWRRGDLTAPEPRPGTLADYEWRGLRPPQNRHWAVRREQLDQWDAEGRIVYSSTRYPQYKRYLDEMPGVALQAFWEDIPVINNRSKEFLGWNTQKPLALLERLIAASSNEGDLVLDPFCGCGTATIAAEKLKRKWIGIDITHLSIAVMRSRLLDSFGLVDVPVHGVPADLESARLLAAQSKDGRYEFQWWALSLVDARPLGEERKKGADRGIDGVLTFSERDAIRRILV